METPKRLTILIIVAVLTTCPIQAAEQTSTKISDTRIASCLVKVTCDPVVLPLSFETIDYLLHSSGVGGKAIREVLNATPDMVQDLFMIEYIHELTPKASPESSMGRSSGSGEGMEEYEYAMTMEAEYGMEMGRSRPGRPTTSGRTRRTRPTPRTVTISNLPADEKTYLFSLHVELPNEVKRAAEEFMEALVFNLRNALLSTFDEHKQKLRKQVELADEEATRAEHDLSMKQEKLRIISESRILDRDMILGKISNLRNDIQEIEMEQASNKVVVDATTNQIAEIQFKMQKEIEKDAVTKELTELLVMQEKNLQNIEKLHQNGSASVSDLADAQQKLARARIELAQRREQLSKSAGGNLLGSLNSTLANYSLNETKNKMKLERLVNQLSEAEGFLRKADDYELLSLKVDIAKQNLQETILWRDRMSRQIRMIQPPTVSVIGGN